MSWTVIQSHYKLLPWRPDWSRRPTARLVWRNADSASALDGREARCVPCSEPIWELEYQVYIEDADIDRRLRDLARDPRVAVPLWGSGLPGSVSDTYAFTVDCDLWPYFGSEFRVALGDPAGAELQVVTAQSAYNRDIATAEPITISADPLYAWPVLLGELEARQITRLHLTAVQAQLRVRQTVPFRYGVPETSPPPPPPGECGYLFEHYPGAADNFECYDIGAVGDTLPNYGDGWDEAWVITDLTPVIIDATDDFESYPLGAVGDTLPNYGDGWDETWVITDLEE